MSHALVHLKMGLCVFILSLSCLHTFWRVILTSFYALEKSNQLKGVAYDHIKFKPGLTLVNSA